MNSFKMTNYDFVRNVTCPRQKIEAIIFKTKRLLVIRADS